MTNLDASPLEVNAVALAAGECDRDVVLSLLPVAGGPLPLVLLGLVL